MDTTKLTDLFTLANFASERQLSFADLKAIAAREGIKPALRLNGTEYFDLAALRILEELATPSRGASVA
jgi:hypothetical protein